MAIFPIRIFGDPVLRQRAADIEVVDDGVRQLVRDLLETLSSDPNGAGLAAPQIGIVRRAFAWRHEGDTGCLLNPKILDSSGSVLQEEGCLSIPGIYYPVERSESITIGGLDESGTDVELTASGFKARIFQHETDHLDGILFLDRLGPDIQKQAKKQLREYLMGGRVPAPNDRVL